MMEILENCKTTKEARNVLLVNGFTDPTEIEKILEDWENEGGRVDNIKDHKTNFKNQIIKDKVLEEDKQVSHMEE